jgi:hypothetical protein
MVMTELDSRFVTTSMRKLGHDPGDPVLCSHCPFCGSGQITGRSDGGIDCAFCGQSFIVRVQPAFPGMPQAPGMGAPTDAGPDMMGMGDPMMGGDPGMDPGMEGPPGEEGMPPGEDDEGAPPFGDGGDEEDDSGPPPGGGGDSGASDSGPPPPPKGKDKKSKDKKSKKESSRRYRTLAGDELGEDQYVKHLAVLFSGGHPAVLAQLRREAAGPQDDLMIGGQTPDEGYRDERADYDDDDPGEHEASRRRYAS